MEEGRKSCNFKTFLNENQQGSAVPRLMSENWRVEGGRRRERGWEGESILTGEWGGEDNYGERRSSQAGARKLGHKKKVWELALYTTDIRIRENVDVS